MLKGQWPPRHTETSGAWLPPLKGRMVHPLQGGPLQRQPWSSEWVIDTPQGPTRSPESPEDTVDLPEVNACFVSVFNTLYHKNYTIYIIIYYMAGWEQDFQLMICPQLMLGSTTPYNHQPTGVLNIAYVLTGNRTFLWAAFAAAWTRITSESASSPLKSDGAAVKVHRLGKTHASTLRIRTWHVIMSSVAFSDFNSFENPCL